VDTGCGPNLIGKDVLPQKWHSLIQPCSSPSLTGASGTTLDLLGVIPLYVTIGQLRVRIWFGVLPSLPPRILLGTSFIDRFVTQLLPQKRRIVLNKAGWIPILSSSRSRLVNSIHEPGLLDSHDNFDKHADHEQEHAIRLTKSVRLQPGHQLLVQVTTPMTGLIHISPHWRSAHKQNVMAAHGVADVRPNAPFKIFLANFGHTPVYLPKHMRVAYANPPPSVLVEYDPRGRGLREEGVTADKPVTVDQMDANADMTTGDNTIADRNDPPYRKQVTFMDKVQVLTGKGVHKQTGLRPDWTTAFTSETRHGMTYTGDLKVSAVSRNAKANSDEKIDQHKRLNEEMKKEQELDWKDTVNVDAANLEYKQDLLKLLDNYTHMWDGRIGNVKAAKHRINLVPGA